jgi:hypothetical protein
LPSIAEPVSPRAEINPEKSGVKCMVDPYLTPSALALVTGGYANKEIMK